MTANTAAQQGERDRGEGHWVGGEILEGSGSLDLVFRSLSHF